MLVFIEFFNNFVTNIFQDRYVENKPMYKLNDLFSPQREKKPW